MEQRTTPRFGIPDSSLCDEFFESAQADIGTSERDCRRTPPPNREIRTAPARQRYFPGSDQDGLESREFPECSVHRVQSECGPLEHVTARDQDARAGSLSAAASAASSSRRTARLS